MLNNDWTPLTTHQTCTVSTASLHHCAVVMITLRVLLSGSVVQALWVSCMSAAIHKNLGWGVRHTTILHYLVTCSLNCTNGVFMTFYCFWKFAT